jgi:myo-inositol-1(or 4)-monophosphatase
MFTAEAGRGATVNGTALQVSATKNIQRSFICTGFPYDMQANAEDNLRNFSRFAKIAQAIRRDGSAALDLCYVAMGRFDGFWEMKLNPWDVAAGSLIVTEAGGRVSDFRGDQLSIYGQEILATNGRIHKDMVKVLSKQR